MPNVTKIQSQPYIAHTTTRRSRQLGRLLGREGWAWQYDWFQVILIKRHINHLGFFGPFFLSQRFFIRIHVHLNAGDKRGNITQTFDGTWALRIDQQVTHRLQVSDMGCIDDLFKE